MKDACFYPVRDKSGAFQIKAAASHPQEPVLNPGGRGELEIRPSGAAAASRDNSIITATRCSVSWKMKAFIIVCG